MKIENYTEETATHIINVDEIIEGNWRAQVVAKSDPTDIRWKCVSTLESGLNWAKKEAQS